jgi:Rhodopirellula transposase DDE domain
MKHSNQLCYAMSHILADSTPPHLNERSRRIYAASEAKALGFGGKKLMSKVTGLAYETIQKGIIELESPPYDKKAPDKIRKPGGGRKKNIDKDVSLKQDLENIVEASTRGDPQAPLLWCSKSTRHIADELNKNTTRASHTLVSHLLDDMGYSLQANKKVKEGSDHPDRDAQFNFINEKAKCFQSKNQPVISVDTKKKENVGEFKNTGREYCKKGNPRKVNTYDFPDKEKGKVAPYGVYDISQNKGWVSVGISSDTAEFAVNSIESWWEEMGKSTYPDAQELYITCDGGGSNSVRSRLWKRELQRFSNKINKVIHVSHFPPGTSKWNKIEHKMFSFISQNWRATPLVDLVTIVQLIGSTKTSKGLEIKAKTDTNVYQKGIVISDEEFMTINLKKDSFHGEWNYTISPNK